MSGNPITALWQSIMDTQMENMEERLEDRVAINSIYSQRTVERFWVKADKATVLPDPDTFSTEPITAVAHADVKGKPEGATSSFTAAVIYAERNKARRDELLAKYAAAAAAETTE